MGRFFHISLPSDSLWLLSNDFSTRPWGKGPPKKFQMGSLGQKNAPMSGEKGSVTEDRGHFWIIWIGVCLSDLDSSCCLGTVVKLCFCASLASVLVLKNVTNRCLKRSLGGRQGHWAKSHWCLHGSSCALYPEQKEIVFVWASLLKEGSQMTLRCISFSMWLPCFPTLWVTTTTLRWSVFFGVTWSNKSIFQKNICLLFTNFPAFPKLRKCISPVFLWTGKRRRYRESTRAR